MRAQPFQPLSDRAFLPVGAGHMHALAEKELGKRTHRYPADADQVYDFLFLDIPL